MRTLIILFAVLSAVAIAFFSYGREKSWQLIFGNPDLGALNLTEFTRTQKPHDALLCSAGACADGTKVSDTLPQYTVSPEQLIAAIDAAFANSGLIYERVDDGSDPRSARYVTRSPFMRFPDTNQFTAFENADGTTSLIAYARAQIGYSDGGANFKRLRAITANLPA